MSQAPHVEEPRPLYVAQTGACHQVFLFGRPWCWLPASWPNRPEFRGGRQSGRSLETLEAYRETVAVRAVPESTNIWPLVTATETLSASATPARMFEFATRQAAVGTGATSIEREIVTCQVGVGWLWTCWAIDGSR